MTDLVRQSAEQIVKQNGASSPTEPTARKDPGQFVCRWRPFSLVTILGSAVVCGGGYWLAKGRLEAVMAYLVVCVTVGLIMTLAAMAWASMIALTESARAGALFIVFPPYMVYYATTRWRWMAQPTVLFVCGIAVAIVSIFAAAELLEQLSPE